MISRAFENCKYNDEPLIEDKIANDKGELRPGQKHKIIRRFQKTQNTRDVYHTSTLICSVKLAIIDVSKYWRKIETQ